MTDVFIRRCSCCGAIMYSGFVIGDGEEYYCDSDCLRNVYSEEEYDHMYSNGNAYWTSWD